MKEPKRNWWARPRKLCALERPGGGGRSRRPHRRDDEIWWLKQAGVHTVISTMKSRHNLTAYEDAGLLADSVRRRRRSTGSVLRLSSAAGALSRFTATGTPTSSQQSAPRTSTIVTRDGAALVGADLSLDG